MKTKIKYNKYIPFKGFYAIQLFGTIIVREEYKNIPVSDRTVRHETVHLLNSQDFIPNKKNNKFIFYLNFIIFYLEYFIEWLIKLLFSAFMLGKIRAYRSLATEICAYGNQDNINYQIKRKRFDWLKNITKLVWKL